MQNHKLTFSIVIPAYNGEKYLEKAILSTLNQSRKADEIIVHDDNSTDSTKAICAKYGNLVKYHFNPNGPSGFVQGWNKSIALATSEYISILHQDDLLYPNFLEKAEEILIKNPGIRHLFSLCDYIDSNDTIIQNGEILTNEFKTDSDHVRFSGKEYVCAYQKNYNGMVHIHRCPGVITHQSIFKENCTYNAEAGHIADDDFFYRVGQFTHVVGIMKSLAAYRIHNDSETVSIGDAILVRRLAVDYIYQIKQWRNSVFILGDTHDFFVKKAFKFTTRLFWYGVRFKKIELTEEALALFKLLSGEKSLGIYKIQVVSSYLFCSLIFNLFLKQMLSRRKMIG